MEDLMEETWDFMDQAAMGLHGPYRATTIEDFMDQAAEQTFRKQAADAATSSQASKDDLSAPADHTINMCMQCEVEPGIDWPLGLFCRKCYLELSETGLQAYGHA